MCQNFSSLEYGNCRDFNPCTNADAMFFHLKVNFEKKLKRFFPIEKFPFLIQARTTIMLQCLILHFLLHRLSSGRLWEVINKGKNQIFSSQSGRGRLQEVSNIGIWLGNFWYFGKLVTEERWLQPEVRLYNDINKINALFKAWFKLIPF